MSGYRTAGADLWLRPTPDNGAAAGAAESSCNYRANAGHSAAAMRPAPGMREGSAVRYERRVDDVVSCGKRKPCLLI